MAQELGLFWGQGITFRNVNQVNDTKYLMNWNGRVFDSGYQKPGELHTLETRELQEVWGVDPEPSARFVTVIWAFRRVNVSTIWANTGFQETHYYELLGVLPVSETLQ